MTDQILKAVESPVNENIPQLHSGDIVSVHVKIKEGDRERIQEFKGTVIRLRNSGNNGNFTVRRVASNGIGVERTFLLRSDVQDAFADLCAEPDGAVLQATPLGRLSPLRLPG